MNVNNINHDIEVEIRQMRGRIDEIVNLYNKIDFDDLIEYRHMMQDIAWEIKIVGIESIWYKMW